MKKTVLLLLLCVSLLSWAQQTSTTKSTTRRTTQQQQQTQAPPAAAPDSAEQPQEEMPPPMPAEQPGVAAQPPSSRTHPMYPAVSPDMLQAPQPGHPLDPRDVDVLTGKTSRQYAAPPAAYYYGAPGYGYGYGSGYGYGYPYPAGSMPSFTSSGLLPNSTLNATPRYAPMYFGVFNGRPFFIAGDTTLTNPSSLVFGPVFTPFTPVTPVFSFGNFSRAPQFGTRQPFAGATPTRTAPTKTARPKRP